MSSLSVAAWVEEIKEPRGWGHSRPVHPELPSLREQDSTLVRVIFWLGFGVVLYSCMLCLACGYLLSSTPGFWSLELQKLCLGCQDIQSTLWKARASTEPDRVSDSLFTGFLEGASAIFQSVKVAFLPSEQCLIVVCE